MPPQLVFIHVGKTAGTSLRDMLVARFGPASCSPPFVQSHLTAEQASSLGRFPIICGHISRADHQRWFAARPVITIIREPIDRGSPFLRYVRSLPPDFLDIADEAPADRGADRDPGSPAQLEQHDGAPVGGPLTSPSSYPPCSSGRRRHCGGPFGSAVSAPSPQTSSGCLLFLACGWRWCGRISRLVAQASTKRIPR